VGHDGHSGSLDLLEVAVGVLAVRLVRVVSKWVRGQGLEVALDAGLAGVEDARLVAEGRGHVALRYVELRLDHGHRRHGPAQQVLGVRAGRRPPALVGVRVHVVVDVLLDLWLRREPSSAVGHRTAVRPLALVSPRVLVQNCLLPEVFAALRALVGFLARVDAQVLVEDGPLPEVAAAEAAAVRLLVGVDPQVLREVRLLAEALAALGARVRPRLDVDAAVLEQGGLLLELLLADGAAHVQGHPRTAPVLDHVGEALALFQVLESEVATRPKDGVVHALGVLEVGGVLQVRVGGEAAGALPQLVALRVLVAVER